MQHGTLANNCRPKSSDNEVKRKKTSTASKEPSHRTRDHRLSSPSLAPSNLPNNPDSAVQAMHNTRHTGS